MCHGGTMLDTSSDFENLSNRLTPAAKRLSVSKLFTMTVSAEKITAKAPAACTTRPTSSVPDRTCGARMIPGMISVTELYEY